MYAFSLAEYGLPRFLPACKGWVLVRVIKEYNDYDAMGCYPLFACQDWTMLKSDLDALDGEIVSLTVVTDPFGDYDETFLKECFKDVVKPYKQHFVVDLNQPMESYVCQHHKRNSRKALQNLKIELCANPIGFLDDWVTLYHQLIQRHHIKGLTAFSRTAFQKQLEVPGIVVFRAIYNEKTVGMLLWYVQNRVAYYHLGAYSTTGYNLRASFALFWFAIEYFLSIGLHWLNLGAGAGIANDSADGLTRFKQGWSTGTRMTYLCGRILNRKKYHEIVKEKGIPLKEYFPAYRLGEFS